MPFEKDALKKTGKDKTKIYKILAVLFLLGFGISMICVVKNYITEQKAKAQMEQLANSALADKETEKADEVSPAETETELPDVLAELGITVPELDLDWEELYETNEDIYSWLYIPDTQINYPVLQHETETDYYLTHNLDHSSGRPGCIYTQLLNKKDYSDYNTILYGHNMRNGTMFRDLHLYSDREFFDENRYIYVYTPEKVLVYEIYGVCEVSDTHLMYKYNFITGEGVSAFLEDIEATRSMTKQIAEEMEVAEDARLLTLSTCIDSKPNDRWVVVGVLLGERPLNFYNVINLRF